MKILGYNILFYLAGLQTVSVDQIEAALIDGASSRQRFSKVVLPALSPITFFLLVTNLTYAFFEVYGTIEFMTKGAPAGQPQWRSSRLSGGCEQRRPWQGSGSVSVAVSGGHRYNDVAVRTSGQRVSYGGS